MTTQQEEFLFKGFIGALVFALVVNSLIAAKLADLL